MARFDPAIHVLLLKKCSADARIKVKPANGVWASRKDWITTAFSGLAMTAWERVGVYALLEKGGCPIKPGHEVGGGIELKGELSAFILAVRVLLAVSVAKTWIRGSRPRMTNTKRAKGLHAKQRAAILPRIAALFFPLVVFNYQV